MHKKLEWMTLTVLLAFSTAVAVIFARSALLPPSLETRAPEAPAEAGAPALFEDNPAEKRSTAQFPEEPSANSAAPEKSTQENQPKQRNTLAARKRAPSSHPRRHLRMGPLALASPALPPGSFTLSQVAQHHSRNDCYLAINGKVYDVSSYIGRHPGGARAITSRCGREVTGIFARIHSNRAWDLLRKYQIGTLAPPMKTSPSRVVAAVADALRKANPSAQVVRVEEQGGFYLAKLVVEGTLYELHINSRGSIVKEEIANDERDWKRWNRDTDDRLFS